MEHRQQQLPQQWHFGTMTSAAQRCTDPESACRRRRGTFLIHTCCCHLAVPASSSRTACFAAVVLLEDPLPRAVITTAS